MVVLVLVKIILLSFVSWLLKIRIILMLKINYVSGDIFKHIDNYKTDIILPHIVNIKNCWGAGFVLPLTRKYPLAKTNYHQACDMYKKNPDVLLGQTQIVLVQKEPQIKVANMFAQTLGGPRPLYYNYLARCMDNLKWDCDKNTTIIAPMFGSGLAGGNWSFIEELIEDCWIIEGIPVVIYKL
jgi:hypothetical protein